MKFCPATSTLGSQGLLQSVNVLPHRRHSVAMGFMGLFECLANLTKLRLWLKSFPSGLDTLLNLLLGQHCWPAWPIRCQSPWQGCQACLSFLTTHCSHALVPSWPCLLPIIHKQMGNQRPRYALLTCWQLHTIIGYCWVFLQHFYTPSNWIYLLWAESGIPSKQPQRLKRTTFVGIS